MIINKSPVCLTIDALVIKQSLQRRVIVTFTCSRVYFREGVSTSLDHVGGGRVGVGVRGRESAAVPRVANGFTRGASSRA
jgi:hypothetical protein